MRTPKALAPGGDNGTEEGETLLVQDLGVRGLGVQDLGVCLRI